jgi:hypothetical protein
VDAFRLLAELAREADLGWHQAAEQVEGHGVCETVGADGDGAAGGGTTSAAAGKTRMVPAVTDIKNPIHAAAEPAHNAARTNSRSLPSRGVQELYRAPA